MKCPDMGVLRGLKMYYEERLWSKNIPILKKYTVYFTSISHIHKGIVCVDCSSFSSLFYVVIYIA